MIRLPIRLKLAIALVPPLIGLGVVGFVRFDQSAERVAEVRRQTQLARAVIGPAGLVTTLQNERSWPATELIGSEDQVDVIVEGYEETRRQTDEAIEGFRRFVASSDRVVAEAFAPALEGLDGIGAIRDDIDGFAGVKAPVPESVAFSSDVFRRYTALIAPLFDATTVVSLEVDTDAELRQGIELADSSARLVEAMSLLLTDTITTALLSPGGLDTHEEIRRVAILKYDYDKEVEALREARGPYAALADEHFPADLVDQIQTGVTDTIATGVADIDALVPSGSWLPYLDAIREAISDRAGEVDARAEREQRIALAVLVLVLASVAALAWVAARSLVRPLQVLTRQARHVAGEALPEAVQTVLDTPMGRDVAMPDGIRVELPAGGELVEVAHALESAHTAAVGLAVQQAVLRRNIADAFVSLARRNQNLLSRQLNLITELETGELDPDELASLFRLDHLATRMRRNAESLLVLAGADTPRYRAAPVAVLDVIRAALGEVEGFDRVVLGQIDPAQVTGASSADLVHVVAELLDNALAFSPPNQVVEVHGTGLPGQSYVLAIIDHGVGMPPADVEEANRRLAQGGRNQIAPSEQLGHHVAGTLAARHDVRVYLQLSIRPGMTAVVELPPSIAQLPDRHAGRLPTPSAAG